MTIVKHELRQGNLSFWIWTASIGFLIAICVFLFPEMKGQMEEVNDVFASMGSFTAAFGMDRLNFGTLIGFYSIECGNIQWTRREKASPFNIFLIRCTYPRCHLGQPLFYILFFDCF